MKNQIAAFATLLSIGCLLPLTADCQTVVTLTQTNLGAKVQISSREECAEKVSVLKETADEVRILHGNNELENVTDVEEFCGKQFDYFQHHGGANTK